jgi:hypothetical protein
LKFDPSGFVDSRCVFTLAHHKASELRLCHAHGIAPMVRKFVAHIGVLVWVPRLIDHPEAHFNWSEFALTVLITGAVWMVADLPSL